jgi:hypothetical protein
MQKIGLLLLDESVARDHPVPTQGPDWDIAHLYRYGDAKTRLYRVIRDPATTAVVALGLSPRKIAYAKKALSLGKHVLADFPCAHSPAEVTKLEQLASTKRLCLCSPNLLKAERGLQELRRLASGSDNKLRSLTVTCGMSGKYGQDHLWMRLVQLFDLVEWIADSRCLSVYSEAFTMRQSVRAYSILMSLETGVKGLCNLYSVSSKISQHIWVDGVFHDCILRASLGAQSVKVNYFKGAVSENVDWSPSSLNSVLDDFATEIRKENRISDLQHARRVFELADMVIRSRT